MNHWTFLTTLLVLSFVRDDGRTHRQTLSWDILDEHVVFVEKEDIDQYVGEHPVVLVHWFASVVVIIILDG